ncbi:hypothetical protein P4S54_21930 [Shewanella sp. PP-He15 brown]
MKSGREVPGIRLSKLWLSMAWLLPLCSLSSVVMADAATDNIERLEVRGRQINTLGHSTSASEGIVGAAEIESRPLLRTGKSSNLCQV